MKYQYPKLIRLEKIFKKMGSVLIAYSGGLDSTFLLRVAKDVLGDRVLAVTANSPTFPKEELYFAGDMASALKVRHKIIKTQELRNINFVSNLKERCYFCKKDLFSRLKKIAVTEKLRFVVDASNISDIQDYRPGAKAKRELRVRSPLQEAGFNKDEIRVLSRKLGLPTWNKPSLACLASRIPYGTKITPEILAKVNQAENILRGMGFLQVRLRHYNGLCRIEVNKDQVPKLLDNKDSVVENLKKLGYNYITVDLEGYRTGSMNSVFLKSGKAINSKKG